MKGSVSRGSGFRGLAEYLLLADERKGPRPGAALIGGNMSGATPRELAREFRVARELRPDVARPVWHCSLTLPAGEELSEERWQEVGRALLTKIGMDPDQHQHFLVRHRDTDHDHLHVAGSRIGLDGSVWLGKWEAGREKGPLESGVEYGRKDRTGAPAPAAPEAGWRGDGR